MIVEPAGADAYTIFAQAMDRTGYARGTLARARRDCGAGARARSAPRARRMADMGHGVGAHRMHRQHAPDMATTWPGRCPRLQSASADANGAIPCVDMQAMTPASRLDDPGIGLRDNGRRVLTYADLRSTVRRSRRPRARRARSSCT